MKYSAVIVAAGSSKRFKAGENKLLYTLDDGNKVIDHTLAVFKADPDCDQIVVVVNTEVGNYLFSKKNSGNVVYCYGGKSRAESVYHGLMAVTSENVFVHDGARCFLNLADLNVLKEEFEKSGAAILCRKVTDTIKTVDENGYIVSTIDREALRGAQTPQAFKTDLLI
ncbi:MAG: 2-C-methyl-D-erythritol 4-phosphate cytidylyltransferase, partial [Erysipelotrichaceae bacterium]|nr:2-C-methyl-D-erythritol 4-phosphate cytidylyltransferase [Erysipelotrichaceae bacterium]